MLIQPACCWSIIDGPFPIHATKHPLIHVPFETGAVMASGVKAALDIQGKTDITVMAWVGDGGTLDIGIQSLSGAAERNDDIIYVCYDNEAYMNTGIQRSSATPWGAWTTTTPEENFKTEPKKGIMEIMAAHRIPYAATCTLAYPEDVIAKFKKAKGIKGTKFIHIFAPCPTGWKMAPDLMIQITRMAVEANVFPIYEITNGIHYEINLKPEKKLPVKEYLKLQGRFSHLTEPQIAYVQKYIDFEWELLNKRAACAN
jgi:pyruvate ferredoxin oxidoreductase beta subunit/2-oxoisovalerate ferredoxin oxidoreductase beta subunit